MSISTENEYNDAFRKIDALIAGNFEASAAGREEFLEVAKAIQDYEKRNYPIPKPETVIQKADISAGTYVKITL